MSSDEEELDQEWRVDLAIEEDEEGVPNIVVKRTGEQAYDLLRRVLESGRWDANEEPDFAAVLELTAELMDDEAVLGWVAREVAMEAESDDARDVRDCFQAYRDAVQRDDLDAIANLLDDTTVQRFQQYRKLAAAGESAIAGSATPAVDRVCCELFKARFSPAQLADMGDDEVIAFAVKHLFAGPEGIEHFAIGIIDLDDDDEATAELFAGEMALPIRMHFRRIHGEWRVNVTGLFPLIESAYRSIAMQKGMSTDEFVTDYIASNTAAGLN
jgi:ketosteroid isomerase-like protein